MSLTENKTNNYELSDKLLQDYEIKGIIKMEVPEGVLELKIEFLQECCDFLKYWKKFTTTPERLVYDIVKLAKNDREIIGKLYKVSKRFTSIRKLSCHPFFVDISKQLMNTQMISCFHLSIIRVDLPSEESFLMPPHQDFPYIQGSINGVTVYFGFSDLSLESGIVSANEGSHSEGIIEVSETQERNDPREDINNKKDEKNLSTTDKVVEIYDLEKYLNLEYKQEELKFNQVFFFHTLLLHRSEANLSNSARITAQIRFDDLCNKNSFEKDFPEGRSKDDLFSNNFSEYVK